MYRSTAEGPLLLKRMRSLAAAAATSIISAIIAALATSLRRCKSLSRFVAARPERGLKPGSLCAQRRVKELRGSSKPLGGGLLKEHRDRRDVQTKLCELQQTIKRIVRERLHHR